MLNTKLLAGVALAASLGAGGVLAQGQTFITIGTGGVTGVYYPTGGAICRLVNKNRKKHGIRCSVESTGGSPYNARTIREGELDFGVVQSDVQKDSVEGTGPFEGEGPYPDLRALFSVHSEPMHLMARADAGISGVKDLAGKRVNIGNAGSGQRVMGQVMMSYYGLNNEMLALAAELKSSEQAAALCDGKIDATIWAAGLPNGSSQEAASTCDVVMVPIEGPELDKLLADNSAYAAAVIPGGMYPGNPDDIPSWGPKATIVTSTNTSDDIVYAVVKAVFDNFNDFKKLHPAFANLDEAAMIKDGLTAELHPGAVKYYKDRGWM